MTRPDDIPADVWDAVEAIMAEVDAGADLSTEECIVRAILAERERCAQVCDAFIQAYDEEIASLGLEQARRGSPAKYAVKCIASDIRKGGD